MKTTHRIFYKDSTDMGEIKSDSIDLIITSPPYPMIEMWDDLFCSQNLEIKEAIVQGKGNKAFNLMHRNLNKIWEESTRVLKNGGIICINIGDATRKIANTFQLYPNHVKISSFFQNNGFIGQPIILWRKPTNSPTKFMGSGMLPPNAYMTLEHEYILIFRKGRKRRKFEAKSERRYNSAYFWEERNKWFSDLWLDIPGVSQQLNNSNDIRKRSGAFPLEIPYRLINMFSIYCDNILDPFWGTGTTSLAAMVSGRNSFGYEINSEFSKLFEANISNIKKLTKVLTLKRISNHLEFIDKYLIKKEVKHISRYYQFPVVTNQEKNILFYSVKELKKKADLFEIRYEKFKSNDIN